MTRHWTDSFFLQETVPSQHCDIVTQERHKVTMLPFFIKTEWVSRFIDKLDFIRQTQPMNTCISSCKELVFYSHYTFSLLSHHVSEQHGLAVPAAGEHTTNMLLLGKGTFCVSKWLNLLESTNSSKNNDFK